MTLIPLRKSRGDSHDHLLVAGKSRRQHAEIAHLPIDCDVSSLGASLVDEVNIVAVLTGLNRGLRYHDRFGFHRDLHAHSSHIDPATIARGYWAFAP